MKFWLLLLASSLAVCITACKIGIATYRLRARKGIARVETCTSFPIFILSCLSLGFYANDTATKIILSLGILSLVVYQWAWLWELCDELHEPVVLIPLILQVVCVVAMSVLCGITLPKAHEVLHYLAFSFWVFEYILLGIYCLRLYRQHLQLAKKNISTTKTSRAKTSRARIGKILRWNLWFCLISFMITVISLVLLATRELDFESSLLLEMVAGVWFLRWVWLLATRTFSKKDKSEDEFSTGQSNFAVCDPPFSALKSLEEGLTEPPPVYSRHREIPRDSVLDPEEGSTTSASSGYEYSVTEDGPIRYAFEKCAHECLKMMMGGQSHLAKLESVLNVLDIKTAEGHWAIDFANQYPTAVVIGVDTNKPQFDNVEPRNLVFELDNMQLEWSYQSDRFDYMHCRSLFFWVHDQYRFCREALRCLQPGGILEVQDQASSSQIWYRHLLEAGFTDVQVLLLRIGEAPVNSKEIQDPKIHASFW